MKKRLRKKKKCGEFIEWGCDLVINHDTKESPDIFSDSFVEEAIEANDCCCGVSCTNSKVDGIIQLGMQSQDPKAKLNKVIAWIKAHPDVKDWQVGPLYDLSIV